MSDDKLPGEVIDLSAFTFEKWLNGERPWWDKPEASHVPAFHPRVFARGIIPGASGDPMWLYYVKELNGFVRLESPPGSQAWGACQIEAIPHRLNDHAAIEIIQNARKGE